MPPANHELLLLHGAGLGAWIWNTTKGRLTVPAQAVDLPGRSDGVNPGSVTLQDCVDHVVTLLHAADAPPIIVAHSFSAQIAAVAASQHPERVRAIVLVGGIVPESGKSFLTTLPFPARLVLGVVIRLSRPGVRLPRVAVVKEYCNDLDEATTQMVLDRISPEVPRLYLDPVHWQRLPAHIPLIYIKLLDDRSILPAKQDEIVRRVRATRVETLQGGHLAMLSRPGDMAATLSRISTQLS
jgi:pimeloyl-ACP methyl ester carboxylesterase